MNGLFCATAGSSNTGLPSLPKNMHEEATTDVSTRSRGFVDNETRKIMLAGTSSSHGAPNANGIRDDLSYEADLGAMLQELEKCMARGSKWFKLIQQSRAQL